MKTILVVLLFVSPVFGQDDSAARAAAGCGANEVNFDVKTEKNLHPAPHPQAGKALIYVFQDVNRSSLGSGGMGVTARVGLDGGWVGAISKKSYFFFSADPGDHRLCTNWQSGVDSHSKLASAASLTAEAGNSYYFRTKVYFISRGQLAMKLEALDTVEAQLLIASLSFSTSHPKR
jgi:hypothetical protein